MSTQLPSNRMPPPPGLEALIKYFRQVYPDQPNPLQVTTLLKYWLGGNDPLDYISMYNNPGDPENGIPPHWHYISFGLSDLHGDSRVHSRNMSEQNFLSGMGFELTFRLLKCEKEKMEERELSEKCLRPPTWPANLLQSIARYCFQTGNRLCVGDNIPWKRSLNESHISSKIQNIIVAQDPQLESIETPFGSVNFCQIVGVTEEELEWASRWNGRGILEYLQENNTTGGNWLITDMSRTLSVFELFPEKLTNLRDDLEKQGSDLAGINAEFTFREIKFQVNVDHVKQEIDSDSLSEQCLSDGHSQKHGKYSSGYLKSMSISSNSLDKSCPLDYQPHAPQILSLEGIEITLAPYAAKYLLLAIKDRIRHGRHFTFKSQHLALTLVAESVTGSCATKSAPYGVLGYWIQVLIPEELVPRLISDFQNAKLDSINEVLKQPLEFEWPEHKLKLKIDQPKL